ncbi:hypothetical protein [Psychrobacter sp.]|uniref:type IV pilus modification PilV family protein n=1 Tax=Psychrobacter sp. TaxID=56811 RepID=UPI0025F989B9|nr:hypothetical protein [Psychrobacter sp.]
MATALSLSQIQQQDLGLMEVLVALLLFSSAALGYAAIQTRAISSTTDSAKRLQAVMLLNETLERIRANSQSEDLAIYQAYFNVKEGLESTNCLLEQGCNAAQVARNDVSNLKSQAGSNGFNLGMVDCPTTISIKSLQSKCLIVAWNQTLAGLATSAYDNKNSVQSTSIKCLTTKGEYAKNADCVFVEMY